MLFRQIQNFFRWKVINYFSNSILIYILEIKLAYVFIVIRTTMYISTYKFKKTIVSTRPSGRAQIWHACADRDETGSHLKIDPPHPILIETRLYRRPSGRRPEAAGRPSLWTNQLCAASLRFLGKCYSININASSL